MPNADIPSTAVEIAGTVRHLRFDLRAINRAERALRAEYGEKVTMEKLFSDPTALSYSDIATLAWAGLLHEQPTLALEVFLSQLMPRDLETIGDALMAAWAEAHGVPEVQAGEAQADPPASPTPRSGSDSGPSDDTSLV